MKELFLKCMIEIWCHPKVAKEVEALPVTVDPNTAMLQRVSYYMEAKDQRQEWNQVVQSSDLALVHTLMRHLKLVAEWANRIFKDSMSMLMLKDQNLRLDPSFQSPWARPAAENRKSDQYFPNNLNNKRKWTFIRTLKNLMIHK